MKADHIRAQHAVQQFALPGANTEGLGIGPGNMPEDGDARVRPPLLDHARQQREVIVLHQHHGLFRAFNFVQQRSANFWFTAR